MGEGWVGRIMGWVGGGVSCKGNRICGVVLLVTTFEMIQGSIIPKKCHNILIFKQVVFCWTISIKSYNFAEVRVWWKQRRHGRITKPLAAYLSLAVMVAGALFITLPLLLVLDLPNLTATSYDTIFSFYFTYCIVLQCLYK